MNDLIGNSTPQVKATSWISEDATYYILDGNYIDIKIHKTLGVIDSFIKQGKTTNLAQTGYGFAYNEFRNETANGWGAPNYQKDLTVSTMHEDEEYVVFNVNGTIGNNNFPDTMWVNMTMIFWKDKDYCYIHTWRKHLGSHIDSDNSFDMCFEDDVYDSYAVLNNNDTLITGSFEEEKRVATDLNSTISQQFQWAWMGNSTGGEGAGMVLLPHDNWDYGSLMIDNDFPEIEYTFRGYNGLFIGQDFYGVYENTVEEFSCLMVITDGTYYRVQALAQDMYYDLSTTESIAYPLRGTSPWWNNRYFSIFGAPTFANPDSSVWSMIPYHQNASGYYAFNGLTFVDGTVNSTWTQINFTQTKGRVTFNYTIETWKDSDKIKLYGFWNCDETENITALDFYTTSGDWPSTWYCNATVNSGVGPYDSADDPMEDGYSLAHLRGDFSSDFGESAYVTSFYDASEVVHWQITSYIKIFYLKNTVDQEYPQGTQYNFTIYLSMSSTSDIDETLHGLSSTRTQTVYYSDFLPYDEDNPLKVASECSPLIGVYGSDVLTLTVYGYSGTTTITQVHCGVKGKPTAVYASNGTLTWSYNASTTVLTLNVTHASPTRVLIYWKIPGDVNDNGIVDLHDLAIIGKACEATPVSPKWDEDCDINGDAIIDIFDIGIVSANWGRSS